MMYSVPDFPALPKLGLIATRINSPVKSCNILRARVVSLGRGARALFPPSPHTRRLYTKRDEAC